MSAIVLENKTYVKATKKETLFQKFVKYYMENAEIICMGLAAMNGQSIYPIYRAFHA